MLNLPYFVLWAGSCTSELQLEVNCRKKFVLVCQLFAEPAQILSYNFFQSTIHFQLSFTCTWSGPLPICSSDKIHLQISWNEQENVITHDDDPIGAPNKRSWIGASVSCQVHQRNFAPVISYGEYIISPINPAKAA